MLNHTYQNWTKEASDLRGNHQHQVTLSLRRYRSAGGLARRKCDIFDKTRHCQLCCVWRCFTHIFSNQGAPPEVYRLQRGEVGDGPSEGSSASVADDVSPGAAAAPVRGEGGDKGVRCRRKNEQHIWESKNDVD